MSESPCFVSNRYISPRFAADIRHSAKFVPIYYSKNANLMRKIMPFFNISALINNNQKILAFKMDGGLRLPSTYQLASTAKHTKSARHNDMRQVLTHHDDWFTYCFLIFNTMLNKIGCSSILFLIKQMHLSGILINSFTHCNAITLMKLFVKKWADNFLIL